MREFKPRPPRVPVDLPIAFEHGGAVLSATIVNLGFGGAFVAADQIPAYGEQLALVVQFPGHPEQYRLPAIVRWSDASGFGVQFGRLGARETHELGELIAACRAAVDANTLGEPDGRPTRVPA